MQLLKIYMPSLDTHVVFKVLSPEEIEFFTLQYEYLPKDEYAEKVIEAFIYNLKHEVKEGLAKLPKERAKDSLTILFNGCIMLNPGLDVDLWTGISDYWGSTHSSTELSPFLKRENDLVKAMRDEMLENKRTSPKRANGAITRAQFMNLERHLKSRVIGQDRAIEEIVNALKRSQAGLGDLNRPLGVFLFCGASGVGKTHLARELHKYLFTQDIIRIDCGEYQHKHENQKLIGSPQGYIGHDDGGFLTNAIQKNGHTVLLLDEVEKAHPDIWHTFLSVFDEGYLTDSSGKKADFRNTIIIMTTNLGNGAMVNYLTHTGPGFGSKLTIDLNEVGMPKHSQIERMANEAIRKHFKPEFLNRIDKQIVFEHLSKADYGQIVELELQTVAEKLDKKGFILAWDDDVLEALIAEGINPVQGARGLAQVRRDKIENKIADVILSSRFARGTLFQLVWAPETKRFTVVVERPKRKAKASSTT